MNAYPGPIIVPKAYDIDRLPLNQQHLDCYTLLSSDIILIEHRDRVSFCAFVKENGHIDCYCPDARRGQCAHQQALSNGLWERLRRLSPYEALLADTLAWAGLVLDLIPSIASTEVLA